MPCDPRLTWDKFDKLYEDLITHCIVEDPETRRETVEAGLKARIAAC